MITIYYYNQQEHIGKWINKVSYQIKRSIDVIAARYGITGMQSRILGHLSYMEHTGQPVCHRDIEQLFGIRRSTVTSVVSHLEQNGYLMRKPVPGDARLKELILTEKGRDVARQMDHAIQEFDTSLSSCLSKEEESQLLAMLKTISQMLNGSSTHSCRQIQKKQEDDILC